MQKDLYFSSNTSSLSHCNDIPDIFIDSANSSSPISNFEYSQPHQLLHVQILLLLGSMRTRHYLSGLLGINIHDVGVLSELQAIVYSRPSAIDCIPTAPLRYTNPIPGCNPLSLCNPRSLRKNSTIYLLTNQPLFPSGLLFAMMCFLRQLALHLLLDHQQRLENIGAPANI